jgi:hypothetical protein
MATTAVSTSSLYQELQTYFQQRSSDLQQLGQALQSGDLAGAQQEFQALQTLGQSGPFANGDAFKMSRREQDFEAIGQALQSGDLTGAQQAFAQLESTFRRAEPLSGTVANPDQPTSPVVSSSGQPVAGTTPTSEAGPEVIVNLGSLSPGEQITIGLSNNANGTDQVTVGVANQQGQTPEQITLNLNPNSNEQIVLNLFNSTTTASSQSSGLNVTA